MKNTFLYLMAATVLLFGCSKSDETPEEPTVTEYEIEGIYKSDFDLTMEIRGTTGKVTAFGGQQHDLSRDASKFKLGDAYLRNIRKIDYEKWEADVVKSNYDLVNNILTIKGYETTTITVKADRKSIYLDNPNGFERTFDKTAELSGGGSNGTGSQKGDTLYIGQIAGGLHERKVVSFNVPAGTKTLTVRTAEFDGTDKNSADMFVRFGSEATVTHTYSPAPYAYSSNADCEGIKPNRESELCTFTNPKAGTWYVTLYGYNDYFWSRLIVTASK